MSELPDVGFAAGDTVLVEDLFGASRFADVLDVNSVAEMLGWDKMEARLVRNKFSANGRDLFALLVIPIGPRRAVVVPIFYVAGQWTLSDGHVVKVSKCQRPKPQKGECPECRN